jgi:hypothetical protein
MRIEDYALIGYRRDTLILETDEDVALVNSALNLCGQEKPAEQRAEKKAA